MAAHARGHVETIILCGGRGERLRPFTDDRPKPMVEVGGRPIIAYQLGWLQQHGITSVTLSCGYRWQVLHSFLGDGAPWGLNVRYAVEQTPLGRGGGIRRAMASSSDPNARTLVINGDTVVGLDPWPLIDSHVQSGALATVVLSPLVTVRGIVEFDSEGWVHRFSEKPELPYWVNAGLYVFSPQIVDLLPVRGDHEDTLFPRLARERKLWTYPTRELWRTVDTVKDLSNLSREIQAGLELPSIAPGSAAPT